MYAYRRGEVWDPLKLEQERVLREQIEKDREHEDWIRQVIKYGLNFMKKTFIIILVHEYIC